MASIHTLKNEIKKLSAAANVGLEGYLIQVVNNQTNEVIDSFEVKF